MPHFFKQISYIALVFCLAADTARPALGFAATLPAARPSTLSSTLFQTQAVVPEIIHAHREILPSNPGAAIRREESAQLPKTAASHNSRPEIRVTRLMRGAKLLSRLNPEEVESVRSQFIATVAARPDGSAFITPTTYRASIEDTSLADVQSEIDLDLSEQVTRMARETPTREISVLEWGPSTGRAISELAHLIKQQRLNHVQLYAYSNQYYSAWEHAPDNVTFILDDSTHLPNYLQDHPIDLMFSHYGLTLLRNGYAEHLRRLAPHIHPDGFIQHNQGFNIFHLIPTLPEYEVRVVRRSGQDSVLKLLPRQDHGEIIFLTRNSNSSWRLTATAETLAAPQLESANRPERGTDVIFRLPFHPALSTEEQLDFGEIPPGLAESTWDKHSLLAHPSYSLRQMGMPELNAVIAQLPTENVSKRWQYTLRDLIGELIGNATVRAGTSHVDIAMDLLSPPVGTGFGRVLHVTINQDSCSDLHWHSIQVNKRGYDQYGSQYFQDTTTRKAEGGQHNNGSGFRSFGELLEFGYPAQLTFQRSRIWPHTVRTDLYATLPTATSGTTGIDIPSLTVLLLLPPMGLSLSALHHVVPGIAAIGLYRLVSDPDLLPAVLRWIPLRPGGLAWLTLASTLVLGMAHKSSRTKTLGEWKQQVKQRIKHTQATWRGEDRKQVEQREKIKLRDNVGQSFLKPDAARHTLPGSDPRLRTAA